MGRDNAEIMAAYQRALNDPTNSDHYTHIARLHFQEGSYQAAEEISRRAIGVNPQDARAYTTLCVSLEQQNRFEEAEEACRTAIGLDDQQVDAHYELGFLLLHCGDREGAKIEFERTRELDPNLDGQILQLYELVDL